ncbi:hypothetical protein CRP01_04035 [Flavilitoribacter nigricans DSM 23189 = NBRC 102662]|uniref:Peptidase S74 domain-containing protein n=1 Tax=Flavilitoribacter nigricans (strain ATCC 23147 / DSM 23189 / NBRC 102662 / NCIMB 1420 / SS-2) TaxID=1122177 RepID=A0A2D0NJM2_FLAN2|nr:hypothetical protein CRP01_04035 [Flavilitoribacter nigricans DSM 23189 = NBRC 102662]
MKSVYPFFYLLLGSLSLSAQLKVDGFAQLSGGLEIQNNTVNSYFDIDRLGTNFQDFFLLVNTDRGAISSDRAISMRYTPSTGLRVGIGNLSPEALLHVRGESIIQDENKLLTLRSNGDNAFLAYEYRGGFSGANIGYFYDVGEPYYYIDMPDGLFGEFIMLTDGRIFQNGSLIHSDRRLKSDIQPIHNSMSTIQQLRGVSFRYKSEYTKGQKSASEPTIGLIAQEVEEVLPQLVQERPDGYKAVNYTGLIPLLIEAAKEQQKEIQRQQQQISELTSEVTELRALVEQLLTGQNQTPVQNPVREPKPQARLSQNFPNPFHEDTQVDYFLPENVQNARLDIYTVAGKLIESIPLSQSGNGVITFRAGRLPAGTYLYSLVSGDVVLDTKRMILTH